MTLVAIVTSGCVIKNFKCWQLGGIAWNTGRRAGKRLERSVQSTWRAECFLLCQGRLEEQWRKLMAWIYQVAFLFSSQIIEIRGEKYCSLVFLFLPFSSQKEVQHAHLKPVTDDLLSCFRQVRSACGWGTRSGLSENSGVCRNLVILSPRCCCADSDY